MTTKRGFFEIVGQVLDCLLENPKRKTHIVFRCNLDSRAISKYLKIMIEAGLIEKENEHFHINTKGILFRNKYKELVEIINLKDPEIFKKSSIKTKIMQPIPN